MTGFGAAEGPVAGGVLRVEIRTVNHRFLNVAAKLPPDLAALETDLRERLRKDFDRGHLSVQVRWTAPPAVRAAGLTLDVNRAREAMARLRELQSVVGLSGEVSLDLLARQPDVFTTQDGAEAPASWSELEPIVAEAASQVRATRRREGAHLAEALRSQLGLIRGEGERVRAFAPTRVVRERDRLHRRVAELLDGKPLDEERIAHEVALLADRLDIAEELVRLAAHLDACEAALREDGPVGKRLGFLAQELGREVNTIGSKANDAEMQHAVVAMKGELERFREQLENLE